MEVRKGKVAVAQAQVQKSQARRPHIFELDPLRATTCMGVVAVHVLAFTLYLNSSSLGSLSQNALVVAFHYTREMFMFVTAFAMVYVYFGRPFQLKRFWAKRSIGVLLPYVFWSAVYTWFNFSNHNPLPFLHELYYNLITGNASYQLYYILLTIQFYIILPVFLLFMKYVARHPWVTLAISFLIQVAFLWFSYHYVQKNVLSAYPFWRKFAKYEDTFVLTYEFYFVLGGFAAIYYKQITEFLLRNSWLVISSFVAMLVMLWLHFVIQLRVEHEGMGYALSVLQPVMVFYCLSLILFAFWLVARWASKKNADGKPKGYRFWHMLSDASFGVYLVHALFLNYLRDHVDPHLTGILHSYLGVFLTWLVTVVAAIVVSLVLLRIPVLSRLIGREGPMRKKQEQRPPTSAPREQINVDSSSSTGPQQIATVSN
jgi:membrane-bound acyltransferase YfiQ involved in biofilm formation